MKKSLLIFTILFVLIVGFASVAYAGTHVFYLVNYSGIDIYALYISPSNSDTWGSNILNGVFYNDYQIPITLTGYSPYWDLKIVDRYGNSAYLRSIPLNSYSSYTLHP